MTSPPRRALQLGSTSSASSIPTCTTRNAGCSAKRLRFSLVHRVVPRGTRSCGRLLVDLERESTEFGFVPESQATKSRARCRSHMPHLPVYRTRCASARIQRSRGRLGAARRSFVSFGWRRRQKNHRRELKVCLSDSAVRARGSRRRRHRRAWAKRAAHPATTARSTEQRG